MLNVEKSPRNNSKSNNQQQKTNMSYKHVNPARTWLTSQYKYFDITTPVRMFVG